MEHRALGKSGIQVSEIGFGAWASSRPLLTEDDLQLIESGTGTPTG